MPIAARSKRHPARRGTSPAVRALAAVAAVVLLCAAAYAALWATLTAAIALQAPDPAVLDGDPCCAHPDTWGEVWTGVAWTVAFVAVATVIAAPGVWLASYAATCRRLRIRWTLLLPPVATGLVSVGLVTAVIALPHSPVVDCETFVLRASDLRSDDEERRRRAVRGVEDCGVLDGLRRAAVVRRLGPPDLEGRLGGGRYLVYGDLRLGLRDGRVPHGGPGTRVAGE